VLASENATGRLEVDDFVKWLRAEAAREESAPSVGRVRTAAKLKSRA